MNKSIYEQDLGPLILERGISSAGTQVPNNSLTPCSPVCSFYLFLPASFESISRLKICIQILGVWECASPILHTTSRDGLRSLHSLEQALVPRAALPGATLWRPAWHRLAQPPHPSLPCLCGNGSKWWQSRIPPPPQAVELKLWMLSSCLPAVGGEKADPRTAGTVAARGAAHFRSCNLPGPTGLTNHRYATNHGTNGHGHLAHQIWEWERAHRLSQRRQGLCDGGQRCASNDWVVIL